ncbi:MAG: EamA family transporter [bacterium]
MPLYIIMILFACVLFAAGGVMQKHGIAANFPKLGGRTILRQWKTILRTVLTNWVWVAGTLLVFAGWIFHFQSLGMGDISVVQPLFNVQILMVVLVGVLVLREKVRTVEYAGIAVLLAGAMVLSLSAEEVAPAAMRTWVLLALTAVFFVVIAALGVMLNRRREGSSFEVALAAVGGLLVGLNAVYMKATTVSVTLARRDFDLTTAGSWLGVLTCPYFWAVAVLGLTATAVIQWAYSHGRAAVAIPVINTVQMVVPIIAGVAVFSESLPAARVAGIAVIAAGTLILNRVPEA